MTRKNGCRKCRKKENGLCRKCRKLLAGRGK